MKLTAATIATILSLLPASALGQCSEPLSPCALSLYETSVIWENRAKTQRVLLRGCQKKLEVRTSTVINTLVEVTPPPADDMSAGQRAAYFALTSVVGFVAGIALALLAG